ncbi:MAG: VPLPA-CTERM sorting domain-containing protein [Gammaproteobacteria bacterium]|nr:VPLPA-CTERM sorting domain-containing protein [Gammaproteobacteria bacterium]
MNPVNVLLLTVTCLISHSALAANFFDNFEDGNADGWAQFASGTGSTGVMSNNGSLRAFADARGRSEYSLSRSFSYAAADVLSFDMQVMANSGIELTIGGARTRHASGGVRMSFLDGFNGTLGVPVLFQHRTDGVMPPAYAGVFQNELLNSFSAPLSAYAALAGLDGSSAIAKFSMEFFAASGGGGGGTGSSVAAATVYFDDVNLAPVPLPAAAWFLISALGVLGWTRRRGR